MSVSLKSLSETPALAAAKAPPALKECVLNREVSRTIPHTEIT